MQPDSHSGEVTPPLSAFLRLAMMGCPTLRARGKRTVPTRAAMSLRSQVLQHSLNLRATSERAVARTSLARRALQRSGALRTAGIARTQLLGQSLQGLRGLRGSLGLGKINIKKFSHHSSQSPRHLSAVATFFSRCQQESNNQLSTHNNMAVDFSTASGQATYLCLRHQHCPSP